MVALSPTERLDSLVAEFGSDEEIRDKLLGAYEKFLTNTDAPEDDVVKRFMEPTTSRRYFLEANKSGDLVWNLLDATGKGRRSHRLLLV